MAANLVTTTVTTTTSTQSGQQISVGSTANTIQVGNFVTDVSLNPYIAAQQIGFRATGLRPNIYLNAFFDSVNVTQYCAPGIVAAIGDPLTNSTDGVLLIRATATPTYNPSASSLLQTDNNGTIVGVFNLPAGTFKTRSNDTDYRFRPHTTFAWLTGINGTDAVPDSVHRGDGVRVLPVRRAADDLQGGRSRSLEAEAEIRAGIPEAAGRGAVARAAGADVAETPCRHDGPRQRCPCL